MLASILIIILQNLFTQDINKLMTDIDFHLKIKTAQTMRDIFAKNNRGIKIFIPANSQVKLLKQHIATWYKVFQSKQAIYIKSTDTKIINNKLHILAPTPFYKKAEENIPSSGSLKGKEVYSLFSQINIPTYQVTFKHDKLWIEAKLLKTKINFSPIYYEKIPINTVSTIKQKTLVSKNIDKLIYMPTKYGVLVSQTAKQWYRIKGLNKQFYKIALTDEGCLLANTLISCNFGKNFTQLFPEYAIPKNAQLKELLYSPNGHRLILLTFEGSFDNISYVYDSNKKLWKRLYPEPNFTFSPVKPQQILKYFTKYIKQKHHYKILNSKFAIKDNTIYVSIYAKDKLRKLLISKTFSFNRKWTSSKTHFVRF